MTKKSENFWFWLLNIGIIIKLLTWMWGVKLANLPTILEDRGLGFVISHILTDVVLIVAWFVLLVRIYKRANKKGNAG